MSNQRFNFPDPSKPKAAYVQVYDIVFIYVNENGVTYREDVPSGPRVAMNRHAFYQFINALCALHHYELIKVEDRD